MPLKFLHTADWHLGKPFGGVEDQERRLGLTRARMETVGTLGDIASRTGAEFVVVSGDLFDSPTPDRAVVASACAAVGRIGVAVFVIPGNHDHGGPGGVWTQEFFLAEKKAHAPNLHVLTDREPVDLPGGGKLFPCPLLSRHDPADTTGHLRTLEIPDDALPRIVLAHGSAGDFGATGDERAPNRIFWETLVQPTPGESAPRFDYLALGDWHGVKKLDPRAAYSGTPEPDRFPKNDDYRAGRLLLVSVAARGAIPTVEEITCGRIDWRRAALTITADTDIDAAIEPSLPAANEVGRVALELRLEGETGLEGAKALRLVIERLEARTANLVVRDETRLRPTEEEIGSLAGRAGDPLIAGVARELIDLAATGDRVATHALGLLHAAVNA